jgi:Ca2+-binding EF-hand superfamily protein
MTVSGIGQSISMSSLYAAQRPSASDMANKIFADLDTDSNGVLSTEEIGKEKKHAQDILGADKDKDGSVTLDELVSDITDKINSGSMPPMAPPPSAGDMASNIMDELDTNGDDVLSIDEISKGGERAQKILGADTDNDGIVTMDELVTDITKMEDLKRQSDQANQNSNIDWTTLALNGYSNAQTLLDSVQTSNLSLVA